MGVYWLMICKSFDWVNLNSMIWGYSSIMNSQGLHLMYRAFVCKRPEGASIILSHSRIAIGVPTKQHMEVSWNRGTDKIIHVNGIFPYKPSSYGGTPILGNPYMISHNFNKKMTSLSKWCTKLGQFCLLCLANASSIPCAIQQVLLEHHHLIVDLSLFKH